MEGLAAKHRKEQKDLQSQITQKKKAASKKTRKGVNEECMRLEEELRAKQAQEIVHSETLDSNPKDRQAINEDSDSDALLDSITDSNESGLKSKLSQLNLADDEATTNAAQESASQQRKPNRQKARFARRAAQQQAAILQASDEASYLPDLQAREREKLVAEVERRGFIEMPVAPNGHCMYLAMADQMKHLNLSLAQGSDLQTHGTEKRHEDYKILRHMAAEYISKNAEDFRPFLEEPLGDFVDKVRNTAHWGGQLELLALAKTLNLDINVLQADGRPEQIGAGESSDRPEAWLAYYRHSFGLGEHYNSLRKVTQGEKSVGQDQ